LHFLFLFRFTTTVTITIIATTVTTIIVIAVVVVTNSNFMRGDWLPRRQLRLLLPLPSLPLTLSFLT
jgi:hypothetical protein